VQVIVGDFYSSVTSAVAISVTIPNNVLIFTGGTNPALSKLNAGKPVALVWEPVAADDIQGKVLAHILAQELGAKAKVNVAARNAGYGAALSTIFKDAWTAVGGTIPKFVVYNQDQPTLDTEAQQVAEISPVPVLA
jgi:ABC-type branched-subunit amino acid transport system substrate-binding protein